MDILHVLVTVTRNLSIEHPLFTAVNICGSWSWFVIVNIGVTTLMVKRVRNGFWRLQERLLMFRVSTDVGISYLPRSISYLDLEMLTCFILRESHILYIFVTFWSRFGTLVGTIELATFCNMTFECEHLFVWAHSERWHNWSKIDDGKVLVKHIYISK